jgi:hypothetical protein
MQLSRVRQSRQIGRQKSFCVLIASPAFAQTPPKSNSVTFGNKYVGQDPDAGIRSQLMRDYSTHAGGGGE